MIANNRINNQTIKKAVIFDCDGTLLDTYGLIMKCTRKTFEIVFPDYPASDELIESFFGPLLDDSFRKITSDEAKVQEAISVYRKLVIDLHPEMVRSYPGINEIVKALKKTGTYLAIVSNKVSEVIHLGLSINGIDEYFDLVLGAEKLAKPKPNPDGIGQVCRIFGVNKILFVGDTKIDIDTAKAVKNRELLVKSVGVTWCKAKRTDFQKWGADYIIDKPDELIAVMEGFFNV